MNETRNTESNRVTVWRASFEDISPEIPLLLDVLSADERLKATRFLVAERARQFVISRALLRLLCARYLHTSPEKLSFVTGEFGKPFVAGAPDFNFNISHSSGFACFAFSMANRVGIDVEKIRPLSHEWSTASRVLTVRELGEYARLEEEERQRAFYRVWVLKESYLKGCGRGLSRPTSEVEVSVDLASPPSLRHVAGEPHAPRRWTLCDLPIAEGYAAGLAVEGYDWTVRLGVLTSCDDSLGIQ